MGAKRVGSALHPGPSAEECRTITKERLDRWAKRLDENHSTPLLLLGVGHAERSGELHVLIPEDLPSEVVRAAIRFLYVNHVLKPGEF